MLEVLVVLTYLFFFGALLYYIKRIPVFLTANLLLSSSLPFLRLLGYLLFDEFDLHFKGLPKELYLHVSLLYIFTLTVILVFFKNSYDPVISYVQGFQPKERTLAFVYFSTLCIVLGIMFVFAGTSWIHGNRDSTISTTVPFLRFVYPAAFFISSILLIHSMKMLIFQKKHGLKLNYLFLFAFSMIIFMLIGQRGVMIIIIASFIILSYRLSKLNMTQLFVYFILIFLFGVLARSIIDGSLTLEYLFLIPLKFHYGGDGTQVDSLAFAVSYVQQNGISSTIFYEFLTVLNHRFRIDADLMTASDILNTASLGTDYYISGYGFNFNNTSILVLNYSYFMPLFYVVLIMSYRALMKSLRSISPNADNVFIYYIIMQFFISSIGSFHWLIYIFALVLLIKLITLIMLKSFCIAK